MATDTWCVAAASSRGAAHVRAGLPNQDALATWPESGRGPPVIIVVSDGHGAGQHFRSGVGAQLAVEGAVERLREFLGERTDGRGAVDGTLARRLVETWRDAVRAHLAAHPFTAEEIGRVAEQSGAQVRALEEDPYLAYGATLLASLVAEDLVLYLQLGDGDILAVGEAGQTWRPLPADAQLVANRTTSLCQPRRGRSRAPAGLDSRFHGRLCELVQDRRRFSSDRPGLS
jgi:serine/threonine protein phosphatase PrpC